MDEESVDVHQLSVSYEIIGKCFVPPRAHSTIKKQYEKFQTQRKALGRPFLLTQEKVDKIADVLRSKGENDYPTIEDIMIYVYDTFNSLHAQRFANL